MTNGIRITNQSVEVGISGCHLYHMGTAIKIDDVTPNPEGITVFDPLIVHVNDGINWMAPTNGGLHLNVVGGHINAHANGVTLDRVPQSAIQGTLFYKREDSTQGFSAIIAKTSSCVTISGNIIRGTGTLGAENGIILQAGCHRCTIIGNSVIEQDTAIWLQSSANNNTVVGNAGAFVSKGILDQGTSNVSTGNNF